MNNIIKSFKVELKSAVGVIFSQDGSKVLMGLSNDDDDRSGCWCFVGGGIEKGESSLQAAIREGYEESGILSEPIFTTMLCHPSKPSVAFHILRCGEDHTIKMDKNEFDDMAWFDINNLPFDAMMPLNVEILKMIK